MTIVVHDDLHYKRGLSMPMMGQISSIVACAHVQHSVSEYLQVKYEFGKPFSLVLEQVLSCGGRQAAG